MKQDGSSLVVKQRGRFVLHYQAGMREPRTYAIDAVPERVSNANGHDRLALGPIARRAAFLW